MKNYKFSLSQIRELEKNIVILIDTREKKNEHIINYFEKVGIKYKYQKLDYGDYTFMLQAGNGLSNEVYFHDEIVIERKASLEELSNNLTHKREQFEKELLKAKSNNCKFFLAVENPLGINAIMEKAYNTEMKPISYVASLRTYEQRYNIHLGFLDKSYMGYYINSSFIYFMREFFT